MRVLVTGWAGYIGPVVIRELKARGHAVIGFDTGWFLPNHAEPPEYPDLTVWGDLRDAFPFDANPEVVVHLAGLSNDPMGDLHPNLTDRINYQGTLDMIECFPEAHHTFVSSCSVYGANEMATEASRVEPQTVYAKSKAAVETFLLGSTYDYTILRLGTVYGYSPGHRLDLVVNRMVKDAVDGRPILANAGNPSRPLTHVEDVAAAIALDVEAAIWADTYNVVGDNYRILDLAEEVASFTGADIQTVPASADRRDYMASSEKLRRSGWTPRHTVAGSIPVLAEKSITLPPGNYIRLDALNRLVEMGALTPSLIPARGELAA